MALIEINKNPSGRELIWFGVLLALFFGLIGALIYWQVWDLGGPAVAYWVWSAAALVVAVYFLVPPVRKPLYLGWLYAAFPIGWTVSHLILAIIYYLVITPIGIIMKLCRYDPLQRKLDRSAKTYWKPHQSSEQPGRYFRQF